MPAACSWPAAASPSAATPRLTRTPVTDPLSPFPASWGFLGAPGWWWLAAKFAFFAFAFLWFRATFPRYRYDQIMRLGWKVFIPITIFWIFVTAIMAYNEWFTLGA